MKWPWVRLAEERDRLSASVATRERLNAEAQRTAANEVLKLQASIDRLEQVLEELVGDDQTDE